MIFFFYGPNTYASRAQLKKIVDAYLQKAGGDFGLEKFDGETVQPGQIAPALTAAPFLASSRLVILQYLSRNKAASEAALKVLDQVPDTTVAVFLEQEVDQRTSFFKTLKEKAKPVLFESLPESKLRSFIEGFVKNEGGSIDSAAVRELLLRTGDDQWSLEQELQKLISYSPYISVEDVKLLVAPASKETIFELVDAIAVKDIRRALEVYHALLSERVNEIYILSMIIWQLRNLLFAKAAGKVTAAELAKEAKMSPFVAGKMLERQKKYQEQDLKDAFLEAVETDYRIKTGAGQSGQLVEQLIYRLTS